MIYRVLPLVGSLWVLACSPAGFTLPDPPAQKPVLSPVGLGFDLPADFTEREEGLARVFSGPQNTDSYYTTVSLQTRAGPLQLDEALEETFGDSQSVEHFAWFAREPVFVGETPALLYGVEFEFNEVMQAEVGLLFVHGEQLIDLSCLTPTSMLEATVTVCDNVLATAHLL